VAAPNSTTPPEPDPSQYERKPLRDFYDAYVTSIPSIMSCTDHVAPPPRREHEKFAGWHACGIAELTAVNTLPGGRRERLPADAIKWYLPEHNRVQLVDGLIYHTAQARFVPPWPEGPAWPEEDPPATRIIEDPPPTTQDEERPAPLLENEQQRGRARLLYAMARQQPELASLSVMQAVRVTRGKFKDHPQLAAKDRNSYDKPWQQVRIWLSEDKARQGKS
jgi:hypothetical protein